MSLLIKNIKELLQVRESHISVVKGKDMRVLPSIKNAYLLIEHDTIVDYGSMDDIQNLEADKIIDASGKIVL
ncbi:MAG: imidazolonepropionase, partial [Xanthomarina gelatinilytica]|nr:imidazolonepropionase [Xanthomarina gelatinilytica]